MDVLDVDTLEAPGSGRLQAVRPALGLTVAWHADPRRIGDVCPVLDATPVNRAAPAFRTPQGRPTGPLADPYISRDAIEVVPAGQGAAHVRLLGRGPLEVDGRPVEGSVTVTGQAVLTLARRVVLVLGPIALPRKGSDHGLVGESEAIQEVRRGIERAAQTGVPVLLRGASGTGKELVARAVHAAGDRRAGPYVTVNLAAVPESTAAAAFFGHTKGAFTGAAQAQPGYFGEADGGSLFLDEVGDLPLPLQPLLLRALETGEIQPVGARRARTVDVRLITATDRDLDAAVDAGEFRLPLLHRLAGYDLRIPPLAARRDDIGRLLAHFLEAELTALGAEPRLRGDVRRKVLWLSARKAARLVLDPWAGNIRALRNVARRLAVDWHDAPEVDTLPPLGGAGAPNAQVGAEPARRAHAAASSDAPSAPPGELDEGRVLAAMRASGWVVHAAARRLGVPRSTLYGFIERTGVVPKASELSRETILSTLEAHGGDRAAAADALRVSGRGLATRMKALGVG